MARDIQWGEDVSDIAFDDSPIVDSIDSESPFNENPTETGEDTSGGIDSGGSDLGDIPGTPEERPRRTHARKPLAEIFTFVWAGVGTVLQQTQIDPAVGRTMGFQAPLAGEQLDSLIEGTLVDKVLQPLAGKGENAKSVAAVFALPLVIGMLERNPGNPMFYGVAYNLVAANIADLVPTLKRKRQDNRKLASALADLGEMFEIPRGADPIAFVLQQLLAPEGDENGYEGQGVSEGSSSVA